DLATLGRRAAHATFHTSHATDQVAGITWAMDLTPLLRDPKLPAEQFTAGLIERFQADVVRRIRAFS
ncbi:MAG: PIG-L family deacetylase, partial [Opitutales bacterium]